MTRNEMIKVARQAGFARYMTDGEIEMYKVFAKLLAAKERNRLADELQKMPLNDTANSIAIWIRSQE